MQRKQGRSNMRGLFAAAVAALAALVVPAEAQRVSGARLQYNFLAKECEGKGTLLNTGTGGTAYNLVYPTSGDGALPASADNAFKCPTATLQNRTFNNAYNGVTLTGKTGKTTYEIGPLAEKATNPISGLTSLTVEMWVVPRFLNEDTSTYILAEIGDAFQNGLSSWIVGATENADFRLTFNPRLRVLTATFATSSSSTASSSTAIVLERSFLAPGALNHIVFTMTRTTSITGAVYINGTESDQLSRSSGELIRRAEV
jgi:hypothetical protein